MSIKIISSADSAIATGRVGFVSDHKAVTRKTDFYGNEKTGVTTTKTNLTAMQDLYSLIDSHGYLRAAISVMGRSAVGAWWTLTAHKEANSPKELHRKKLYRFFAEPPGTWTNINDYYSIAYKIAIGVMYFKLFGQVAYHIVRDTNGEAVSMDHIPAFMVPNIDSYGKFKSPAFKAHRVDGTGDVVEYKDQNDIVYIINPDFGGSPMGASDLISLADFTFPIDIYLQLLARSYLQNNTRPELIYQLPESISEENFLDFVEEVTARWRGPQNAGRAPIVVQGDFKVHKIGDLPSDLPYNESRESTRDEEFAVTGVNGPKVGLIDDVSASAMKESRREFHESVMEPLFKVFEESFYWQICVRTFGYRDWRFKFNSPDFLTAVERATVDMRYYQANSVTPNEIRAGLDMDARGDEDGDLFLDQLKQKYGNADDEDLTPDEPQGSPPEGREEEPEDNTPSEDEGDPVRGDGHDTRVRDLIDEVRTWRRFAINRLGSVNARKFNPEHLDEHSARVIQQQLDDALTKEHVDAVFKVVLDVLGEEYE